MLPDGKIDSLKTHLEQFQLRDKTRQDDLQNVLKEYGQLLKEHGQLLKDCEALKKAFEVKKEKPVVALPPPSAYNVKPKDAYVLVLVDGNDYIFNDALIKEKEEGGMRAACLLNDAVEKYIHHSVPHAQKARIIVRIYADLTTLSKQLKNSKVTGPEKRSIAPFSAAFTRAIGLFDFVDALDEEGTKLKIREQFKLASEDTACSHILFAACHNAAYLSQLVPFSGACEKITLVQGAGWNQEYDQFALGVTEFPTVFRWSEVPTTAPTNRTVSSSMAEDPTPYKSIVVTTRPVLRTTSWRRDGPTNGSRSALSSPELTPVRPSSGSNGVSLKNEPSAAQVKFKQPCRHFQKGTCRFGDKCTFSHTPSIKTSSHASNPIPNRSSISSILPKKLTLGFIPVNAQNQRLDAYIRPPTDQEFSVYQGRFHQRKPCNSFHLQQSCTDFNCKFDHSALDPASRHVLSYYLKCTACPRKGDCRLDDCYHGHICQREGCTGQMKGCKMKDLHGIDPRMEGMVPAETREKKVSNVVVEEPLIDITEDVVEHKEVADKYKEAAGEGVTFHW
ncbi:hypothetical protein J1614_010052 [Plenodomus biglobosus]|nr:hypothetical protein J1614_010052 [Plenodomus biglobosus]